MTACMSRFLKNCIVPFTSILLTTTIITLYYSNDKNVLGDDLALHIPVTHDTPWWRFWSTSLAHVNQEHLWHNVIYLSTVGILFEIMQGSFSTLAVYCIGGLTGTLTHVAFSNDKNQRLMGISASCYAILGAYLTHLVFNFCETPYRIAWFALSIVFITTDILLVACDITEDNVAYFAHFGGALQGFLIGFLVIRNYRVLCWQQVYTVCAFLLAMSLIYSLNLHISAD